ncbi:MAG TPA: inorganic phosphate transporter, partial [Helicobacteraceae bacterium]|nr:inorganic phosphate transporter [Helicobacteraceae bacterium]
LKKVWPSIVEMLSFLPQTQKPSFLLALTLGAVGGGVTYLIVKPRVLKKVGGLDGSRHSINQLFTIPLIFAAALLSFAHGANDVANAVGPLAAVHDAMMHNAIATKASIPLWVMIVGGVGIAIGLALFGPRLIRTVGSEITELDQMRAFSIMMAAAITVVIASQLGLPVSSTHIAVGAIFGVGYLREWMDSKRMDEKQVELHTQVNDMHALKEELLEAEKSRDYKKQAELAEALKLQKKKVKTIKRALRDNYVKRGMVNKIIAAWLITVPAAAVLSAIVFWVIQGSTV